MSRCRLIIQEFGNNFDDESSFRTAVVNMKLSIDDGIPIKIPGRDYLYIGSIGCAYNKKTLCEAQLTDILCLAKSTRSKFPDEFHYHRIDLLDSPEQDISLFFEETNALINAVRYCNGRILVHCYQGKSRSAAIICGHLIREYGLSTEDSLALIRTVRPIAQPNPGFMRALHQLETECSMQREGTSAKEARSDVDADNDCDVKLTSNI